MICSVCNSSSKELFQTKLLTKYNVTYFKCSNCGFIQTEVPYWLQEAYGSAITSLDVGLVFRNLNLSKVAEYVIKKYFNYSASFLDYAGGYGLFVRLMRDKGFDFYWYDAFCENLFAKDQDILNEPKGKKIEMVTAFEVFEHLDNPLMEIAKMFEYSDTILFSTELQPAKKIEKPEDWWYIMPQTGQHISLYSRQSLEVLAEKFNCYLFTNNSSIHLLTKKKLKDDPFKAYGKLSFPQRVLKKFVSFASNSNNENIKLVSLLEKDYDKAKSKLINQKTD